MVVKDVVCPKCKSSLIRKYDVVYCTACNSVFSIKDNIINFHPKIDKFYEGKFGVEKKRLDYYRKWILAIYAYITVSAFGLRLKHMKYYKKLGNHSRVLDIGCGGGELSLKIRDFFVVGIDISLSSLKQASLIYDRVYKNKVPNLPFPDNSFDCVCSFDLFGHISSETKNILLQEIHRVLKPGGLSFHYIEVDSKRGINNWAKLDPKSVREIFH